MTDTRDPRYLRTVGLSLLAALLVVASCEVEQAPTALANPTTVPADPPVVRIEQPPNQTEPTPSLEEALQAELERLRAESAADQSGDVAPAQAASQEIRPQDAAAVQAGPVFTPMTVRPEIRNRAEAQAALMREYPPILRDAGIGGTVVVWFYVSDEGFVSDRRVSKSSGQAQLDAAALNVAEVIQFTPAMNGTEPVAVWIEVPITFVVN